jgi:hypothetical protein
MLEHICSLEQKVNDVDVIYSLKIAVNVSVH